MLTPEEKQWGNGVTPRYPWTTALIKNHGFTTHTQQFTQFLIDIRFFNTNAHNRK